MRSYGIISPQFWTGKTGKEIQACGPEAIILATYLMTSPHSHMCGLYFLNKQYIVLDTGRPIKAVDKAFQQLSGLASGAFAFYDEDSQYVWVPEMLRWQVGELKPRDSRIQGIINWYRSLPPIPFVLAFFDRYSEELPGLIKRDITKKKTGPQGGVEGAVEGAVKGPHIPAPAPDPVPVSGSEGGPGETVPVDEPKKYGEFGQAELTDAQYGKLEDTLGSENLKAYIRRFDRWKEQNKTVKKYRNRTAYLTIQDWWERDLAEGKMKSRASPSLFVANDPNLKGENSGDPNLRAAKDFIDRRLAKTVCASVSDVRQDA